MFFVPSKSRCSKKWAKPVLPSSSSLKPAVMIMTPLIFFFPHSSKTGATRVFLITITARSIYLGTSKTVLYAFLEKTVSLEGLIG